MSKVRENDVVKVHYTGKLNDGQVFDSSLEREPLQVELGKGQLIPGFEKGMMGIEIGDPKPIVVPSKEAHGQIIVI